MFTTGSSWCCDISLHLQYDTNGIARKLADVERVPFGKSLTSKSDVELALRRAQAAILTPTDPIESFVDMDTVALERHRRTNTPSTNKFSKNTIVVTIHDPDGANLSFLDLPGEL